VIPGKDLPAFALDSATSLHYALACKSRISVTHKREEVAMKHVQTKAILALLVIVLLAAAFPLGSAAGAGLNATLKIENRSAKPVYLWLSGPDYYYFSVAANTTATYTPFKGIYEMTLYSCSLYAYETLDLTRQNNQIIVPDCGEKDGPGTNQPNTTDSSDLLRLVAVDLVNETGGSIFLILSGPAPYVFVIPADDTKEVTIPKGVYSYRLWACGKYETGSFLAYANSTKKFDCPK
jgi:hypothetical protein